MELQELVQIDNLILNNSNSMWYYIKKPVLNVLILHEYVPKFEKNHVNNNHMNMAIKDPRLTIIWKEWIEAMEYKQRIIKGIIVVRNPFEVAKSLGKRNGMEQDYVLCLWYRYNWECLLFAKEYESVWLSYGEYFNDFAMVCKKVGTFVDINDWGEGEKLENVVDNKIRHFEELDKETKTEIENNAMSLYTSLLKICNK